MVAMKNTLEDRVTHCNIEQISTEIKSLFLSIGNFLLENIFGNAPEPKPQCSTFAHSLNYITKTRATEKRKKTILSQNTNPN